MIPELETERMWLRPVRLEDAESRVQSRVEVLSGRSRICDRLSLSDSLRMTIFANVALSRNLGAGLTAVKAVASYRTRKWL
jgi:hypothetical protein